MTEPFPERWQRVQELLDGALNLDPDQVGPFLDTACVGDHELRDEVEHLVEACRRAEGFLVEPPTRLVAALFDDSRIEDQRRIGPYRIVDEVGRGGMGVVYVAERDDGQFRHRVALKVVLSELKSEHALRRFREERQILASLSHPAIARLLDGGVTADGRPYFAMDYVDGTPIDAFCDAHRLDIDRRLELFVRICDAVQYAHQNLVIHRDLKPSNILVTAEGEIKLLDFGIAKMLPPEGEASPGEATALRWLTPQYASPEQVRGEPMTTASDVYSLGVLLYELLTRQRPYRLATTSPAEIERAICEQEPEPPSAAVLRSETGQRPRLDRSSRRLKGDLDTIVGMALRKEPSRRYAAVGDLGDDVRRHLRGQPVRARPSAFSYRAAKFARRHRVGVAASVALVVAMSVGVTSTVLQARIAERERDNARQQAETASRVSGILVDMFRLSDPDATRGATITAREVLARGAGRVETELAGQPELRARMLGEIGRVYQNLALYDDAERLVTQAADVWRSRGRSAELALAIDQLGEVDQARGRSASAEAHFREALTLQRALHRGANADIAMGMTHLADAQSAQRKHDQAEPLYRQAVAMQRELHGNRDPKVAATLYALATSLHDRGNFAEAEPLFREALVIYRTIPGKPDPLAARALINLGTVLTFREQYDEAEPLLREALAMRRTIYGEQHPAIVEALTGLGTLLHNTSRLAEAEPVLREATALHARLLGTDHPSTFPTKLVLAATLTDRAQYAESQQLFDEVIDGSGASDPQAVYARIHLANSELARGRPASARDHFGQALQQSRKLFGESHPYIALAQHGLARVELESGQFGAAEGGLRRAITILEKTVRPDHRYLLAVRRTLAEAVTHTGDHEVAESLLRGVLEIERRRLPKAHIDLARTLHAYGTLRLTMGDAAAAEPMLREALEIRRDRLGPDHWQAGETESVLGACLAQLRRSEAETLLMHGHQLLRAARGPNDERTLRALDRLAQYRKARY